MTTDVIFWQRLDLPGLERLELSVAGGARTARSHVLSLENGGLDLVHRWWMDADWQVHTMAVESRDRDGAHRLLLERDGRDWKVDGVRRDDLQGAALPDLSVTPWCNTFAIQALRRAARGDLTLDVVFIDAATMQVVRSRQRYVRKSAGRVRYIDLGFAAGFEADLVVDGSGLVVQYESLFSRVYPEDHGPAAPGGDRQGRSA